MPLRKLTPLAALPLLALGATPASAAIVETDRSCYLQQPSTTVTVRGGGFTPGSAFNVLLDEQALPGGTAAIGADGTMFGSFQPPTLGRTEIQHRYRLSVTTAQESAAADFTLTRLSASFWPTKGNARRMRVRFSLFGFNLAGKADRAYVHYVSPTGKLRRTIALGRPAGQCGAIPKTKLRRLFPFRAGPGIWRLQFDTRRRYTRGTSKSSFLFYTVKVRVKTTSR